MTPDLAHLNPLPFGLPPRPLHALPLHRLHVAVDVWGVSDKLDSFLSTKKAARERADHLAGSGGGGGGNSAWGVWGGSAAAGASAAAGKKGKSSSIGGAFVDERRREEAERIRGQVDRVVRPALWKRVSSGPTKLECKVGNCLF